MAVGRINGVTPLLGFCYGKMYGSLARTKECGRFKEVTVRQGLTVVHYI